MSVHPADPIAKMADLVIAHLSRRDEVSFGRPLEAPAAPVDQFHVWGRQEGTFSPVMSVPATVYFATIQHLVDAVEAREATAARVSQLIEDLANGGVERATVEHERCGVYVSSSGWSVPLRVRFESDNTVRLSLTSEAAPRPSAAGESVSLV